MERYLWKLNFDCRRSGSVTGLFVATEQDIKKAIGYYVHFGEVLGKHSNVSGELEESDIKRMDLDSETVEKVAKILGETWSGYNPLHYIEDINYLLNDLYDEEIKQLALKMELDITQCSSVDLIEDLIRDGANEFDFDYLEIMVNEIKEDK